MDGKRGKCICLCRSGSIGYYHQHILSKVRGNHLNNSSTWKTDGWKNGWVCGREGERGWDRGKMLEEEEKRKAKRGRKTSVMDWVTDKPRERETKGWRMMWVRKDEKDKQIKARLDLSSGNEYNTSVGVCVFENGFQNINESLQREHKRKLSFSQLPVPSAALAPFIQICTIM